MKNLICITVVILLILTKTNIKAQNKMENSQTLAQKEQSIVYIAALTAVGDLAMLKIQLNKGLDNGLTLNEIKEVLVQLYAYCGFPRSLNGINTFMNMLEERKANGIQDIEGREAAKVNDTNGLPDDFKGIAELIFGESGIHSHTDMGLQLCSHTSHCC